MIIENSAARISCALLEINEQQYAALLLTPDVLLSHMDALGVQLGDLTKSEDTVWTGEKTLVSGPFTLKMDHPFTTSSLVVEGAPTTHVASTITLWNLTGTAKTINVKAATSGSFWVTPICGIIKCAAFIRMMDHVRTLPLSATQRAEYTRSLEETRDLKDQLTKMAPAVFRLAEEYVCVLASVIYVRRTVAVPADGSVFTIVAPASLPSTVKSTMEAVNFRTRNDVKVVYPGYDLTAINTYLDSVGVTAWLDESFDWLAINNSLTFTRELSEQAAAFVVQEYDKYAFILGEFASWYHGNITYDAASFASIMNALTVVLHKLGAGTLAIVPSAQHRSLLSVVTAADNLSKEQAMAVCAGVDLLRKRIVTTLQAPVGPTFAEAAELAVLNTLMSVPYFDWPAQYQERLVYNNDQLVYQVGGDATRKAILDFEGNSEYRHWVTALFGDADTQAAAKEMWLSLVTMSEIVVTMLASASVVYYNVGDVAYARIEAKYSKLYSQIMHYINSPTDTIIVPVRRFK